MNVKEDVMKRKSGERKNNYICICWGGKEMLAEYEETMNERLKRYKNYSILKLFIDK